MPERKSLALVLWEKALPLSRRMELAPEDMRKRWESAHEAPLLADLRASLSSERPSAQEFANALARVAQPRNAASQKIDHWITEQLRTGAIVGLGFEPPRRVHSRPVAVPANCWRHGIGSGTGKLAVDGFTFIEVRILPRAEADQIVSAWECETVPPHPAPKRGPRSSATDIAEAFDALRMAGKIDPAASAKSHFPTIRAWLRFHRQEAGYSETKPSDETIRKTVQPMLERLRESR